MPELKLVPPAAKKRKEATPRPTVERHFTQLARPRLRTLAVTSGKGGVGKSTVAANLALELGALGARVLLFDGDLAQANLDLLLGVSSRWDLGHVLRGERTLEQVAVEVGPNVRLVPAASGDRDLADLDDFRREGLYRELSRISSEADLVLLDTASGKPAAGMTVTLDRQGESGWAFIAQRTTDDNGRQQTLLPDGAVLDASIYRLTFDTGAYFARVGRATFYPEVRIVFEVRNPAEHYHVPLLISPFGYTTYRGS